MGSAGKEPYSYRHSKAGRVLRVPDAFLPVCEALSAAGLVVLSQNEQGFFEGQLTQACPNALARGMDMASASPAKDSKAGIAASQRFP